MEADGPLKRWYLLTTLHGITAQKTLTGIITAMKTSKLNMDMLISSYFMSNTVTPFPN